MHWHLYPTIPRFPLHTLKDQTRLPSHYLQCERHCFPSCPYSGSMRPKSLLQDMTASQSLSKDPNKDGTYPPSYPYEIILTHGVGSSVEVWMTLRKAQVAETTRLQHLIC